MADIDTTGNTPRETPREGIDALKARMASGLPYNALDPVLRPYRRRCMELLDTFNSTGLPDFAAREDILGDLVDELGPGGWVMPRFVCEFGFFIRIGARTNINFDAVLLDCAPITVGSHVMMGPRCQLLTGNHSLDPQLRRAGWEEARPITIEDGVWLGAGVTVLPGVTIGRDTVVGAGSVVTTNLPPGVIAVGNPARLVRHLSPSDARSVTP
ncbi:sugar O-acetyltransferase [Sorangium sp. So ce385]|uniref:sugar O-acetyltransferase n=1 Tax=Sorangium sp. So ce385 TaxID=3133308 RepID=UPI003F5B320C